MILFKILKEIYFHFFATSTQKEVRVLYNSFYMYSSAVTLPGTASSTSTTYMCGHMYVYVLRITM